jgi:spore germination protein YaaH
MTYDQYGRTSSQPGSGAQVTWVEKNMKKLIELVKPEKLLLGVPLYAYIWEEKIEADGTRTLTSPAKSVPMNEMQKLIQDNQATLQWDAESGQFLASYTRDGTQYSIWLEDRNSISLKLSLVHKYQLAGAAAWRKSQGSEGIWETLSTTLKDITSYDQWQKLNQDGEYVSRP